MSELLEKIGTGLAEKARAFSQAAQAVLVNRKNRVEADIEAMQKREESFQVYVQLTSELEKANVRLVEMTKVIRQRISPANTDSYLAEFAGCSSWGHLDLAEAEICKHIVWTFVRDNLDSLLAQMKARGTASLEKSVADFKREHAAIVKEFGG
jgi:hypothetical protein